MVSAELLLETTVFTFEELAKETHMDAIKFDRTPYNVTYMQDGKQVTIRRVPPEKLHDILPTDKVELNLRHSDDFEAGEKYSVKGVSSRQPNILQIENDAGQTTFVPYFDAELKSKVAARNGVDPRDEPINNRYLLWP